MFKFIILFLVIIGVTMVISGYNAQQMKCPAPTIQYKYIEKSFDDLEADLPKPSNVFSTMFDQSSPLDT